MNEILPTLTDLLAAGPKGCAGHYFDSRGQHPTFGRQPHVAYCQ
jgi:hypothetical protein